MESLVGTPANHCTLFSAPRLVHMRIGVVWCPCAAHMLPMCCLCAAHMLPMCCTYAAMCCPCAGVNCLFGEWGPMRYPEVSHRDQCPYIFCHFSNSTYHISSWCVKHISFYTWSHNKKKKTLNILSRLKQKSYGVKIQNYFFENLTQSLFHWIVKYESLL